MALGWKALGLITTLTAGAVSVVSGIIDDKKRSEEIREEVRKEVAKQTGEES